MTLFKQQNVFFDESSTDIVTHQTYDYPKNHFFFFTRFPHIFTIKYLISKIKLLEKCRVEKFIIENIELF